MNIMWMRGSQGLLFFFEFDMRDKNPAICKKKASTFSIITDNIDKKHL